tara:strand:- start:10357 stop:11010 length:654 start_codon:yes stop_codon:yes gene_type:complete
MTLFITLTGPRGVGKDYVAKKLRDSLRKLNVNAHRMSLARPIKETVSDLTGLSFEDIEVMKRSPATGVRQLLIDVGMAGRKYDENFWINKVKEESKYLDVAIVPDVRFKNEIREFGGMNLCVYDDTMSPPPSTMVDPSEELAWDAHGIAVMRSARMATSARLRFLKSRLFGFDGRPISGEGSPWRFVLNNKRPANLGQLDARVDALAEEVRYKLMRS